MKPSQIKAAWKMMPWWAKAADTVALVCVAYTAVSIASKAYKLYKR